MQHQPATPPEPITIARRFCGPPRSGNGGYTCGLLAARLAGPAEVTLKQPPPLDRPLTVARSPTGLVLLDGDAPIAEARPAHLDLLPPPCPGLGAATAAAARYHGLVEHAFPSCFVCGTGRAPGDGLRIFAGAVDDAVHDAAHDAPDDTAEGAGLVACPWKPEMALAAADGMLRPEFAWAALDCPGAWAWLSELENPLVLGRLAVAIDGPVLPGHLHVVGGWRLGREGRKFYSGTAIWRADGTVCARARATWIEVDAARFAADN